MSTTAKGYLQSRREVKVDPEMLARFEAFCLETNPSLYLAAQASCLCLNEARKKAQTMPGKDLVECLRVTTTIGILGECARRTHGVRSGMHGDHYGGTAYQHLQNIATIMSSEQKSSRRILAKNPDRKQHV